jgi:hypothetical protein
MVSSIHSQSAKKISLVMQLSRTSRVCIEPCLSQGPQLCRVSCKSKVGEQNIIFKKHEAENKLTLLFVLFVNEDQSS